METLRLRKIKNKLIPSFQSLKFRHNKNGVLLVVKHSINAQTRPEKFEFEKAMEAYQKVSSKYRNALRELAE
ncbi:AbrB/MazE/SpoVT family DNA-binding domain-containing protein [Nostoc sp. C057]|uniref:AbrB/MazE/SpoVT family DNA-binding domain-containing protein n=1 Tax=Nostoc sp. C057 TaxID=2576903 RepID=UPI0015C36898|nr:AbrB/MazE/SpoVT family DNA-binding domain-containing protein [Nostoc sp. C057]QLE50705.1 AbrB/MazE/SpoVT family DNA-binding domain-containing protein [Nostoc sp. C057]